MKINLKKIFWENKEGILLGAIAGYLIGRFMIPADFNFSVVAQSNSILDTFKSASTSAIEFAKTKVIWGTTIIGASLGGIIDSQLKEGFLKKFKRWF